MVEPLVIPRAEHPISRRSIDPDALRVLYRLKEAGFTAYLVGGSVRDLLLGRKPKDYDIGTSAHPYQVKRLFRNCFIIGRRFRLAHVKFGQKVIEVATFRRQVPAADAEEVAPGVPPASAAGVEAQHARDLLIHRDNTFGTPEEDAFRRDFTINALAYDIATFSIIDYVGGLEDLRAKVVRSIGNPDDRFREDPVRMLRAIAFASRLGFRVDEPSYEAIGRNRMELARSSPARLLEEYYKILRSGASERTFRALAEVGLLEPVTPALQRGASERLWNSLADVDRYRLRFETAPPSLTTAILAGSLLAPLGFTPDVYARREPPEPASPRTVLGPLPVARKDLERLRHVLLLQRRLRDESLPPRAARAMMARSAFPEALVWLDVHGGAPELVERWHALAHDLAAPAPAGSAPGAVVPRRRRRRRRRRFPRPPRT
ncbi:MAG: pcnB [Acidobacteria bacterium]|nr:pcnB [Acidobacteriota bacterium]